MELAWQGLPRTNTSLMCQWPCKIIFWPGYQYADTLAAVSAEWTYYIMLSKENEIDQ